MKQEKKNEESEYGDEESAQNREDGPPSVLNVAPLVGAHLE